MNGRPGFPPISPNGSEWSGYSQYNRSSNQPTPYSSGLPHQRGDLITPPVSGSSNGTQPRMSGGMNRRPGDPSPPNSVARSSYGTSLSTSDHQRRKTLQMEERLSQHYVILKRYLAQALRDEKGSAKPNRARDKLLRLSPVQFQELSTDVYDELLRRQSAAGQQTSGPGQVPPYLLPKDNFHPKRNQAREKLATLPSPRFRDLATDVFYELERRFPSFAGRDIPRNGSPAPSVAGYGPPSRVGTPNGFREEPRGPGPRPGGHGYGPRNASLSGQVMSGMGIPGGPDDQYGRPTAKTFQSNTIIPNKSTMVEDDDDDNMSDVYGGRRDTTLTSRSGAGSETQRKAIVEFESQVSDLQNRIKDLEKHVREKDQELVRLNDRQSENKSEQDRWADLQANLEGKLRNARNLNDSLQSELDKVQNDHVVSERELRSQIEAISGQANEDDEWRSRYKSLDESHQNLRNELQRQEMVTGEVRQEATGFLSQMKTLSERTGQSLEREEQLVQRVHKLENELKEWKSRYAQAKTQAKRRSSTAGLLQQPNIGGLAKEASLAAESGLVNGIHITQFQIAMDELLQSARGNEPQAVLPHVKSVVVAVRQITTDLRDAQSGEDESKQMQKLVAKLSATAQNLITAAKNFAVSHGLSPVSLLDAAASHLAASVVELIRVVKIRPMPIEDVEDDDQLTTDSADNLYDPRFSVDESIYSPMNTPHQAQKASAFSSLNSQARPPPKQIPNGIPNGLHPASPPKLTPAVYRSPEIQNQELKSFLNTRTPPLLSTIQTLITATRHPSTPPPQILDTIQSITTTVSTFLNYATPRLPPASQPGRLVAELTAMVERLEDLGREGEGIYGDEDGEAVWGGYLRGLPKVCFEIGSGVRELGGLVGGGGSGGAGGEEREEEEFS